MNSIGTLDFAAAQTVAALLTSIWQGAALVLVLALVLPWFKRVNAATRYVIWLATFGAIFVVTFLNLGTTRFSTLVQPPAPVPAVAPGAITDAVARNPASVEPLSLPVETAPDPETGLVGGMAARQFRVGQAPNGFTISISSGARWPELVLALAVGIGTVFLLRVIVGLRRLISLKRQAVPGDLGIRERLRLRLHERGMSRPVEVLFSDKTSTPAAVGYWRPAILLPTGALQIWDPAELEQVVLHEAAHLMRWDDWILIVQQVVRALLWWHPAVQFASARLTTERELACDQWVCAEHEPKAFARCLLKLAESGRALRQSDLAPGILAKRSQLSRRVEALLTTGPVRTARASRLTCSCVLFFVFAALAGLVHVPLLIQAAQDTTASNVSTQDDQRAAIETPATAAPLSASESQDDSMAQDVTNRRVRMAKKALREIDEYRTSGKPWPDFPLIQGEPKLQALKRELSIAQGELDDLSLRYKSKHPAYIQAQHKVDTLRARLDALAHDGVLQLTDMSKAMVEENQRETEARTGTVKNSLSAGQPLGTPAASPGSLDPINETDSLFEELHLAEQQLALARQAQQAGAASQQEVLQLQREILALKRSLAMSEKKAVRSDLIDELKVPSAQEVQRSKELRQQVTASLLGLINQETNANLRLSALESLIHLDNSDTSALLSHLVLEDKDQHIRQVALSALTVHQSLANTESVLNLFDKLGDSDLQLKRMIVVRLGLTDRVSSPDEKLRIAAKAIATLQEIAAKSEWPDLRKDAIRQLGAIGNRLEARND